VGFNPRGTQGLFLPFRNCYAYFGELWTGSSPCLSSPARRCPVRGARAHRGEDVCGHRHVRVRGDVRCLRGWVGAPDFTFDASRRLLTRIFMCQWRLCVGRGNEHQVQWIEHRRLREPSLGNAFERARRAAQSPSLMQLLGCAGNWLTHAVLADTFPTGAGPASAATHHHSGGPWLHPGRVPTCSA